MSLFPSKLMRSIFRLICALNVFGKIVNIFIVKNRFKLKVQWKGCKVCMHNIWPNIQTADHPIINSNNPRGHPDCVILAWRPKKKGKGENDRLFMKFMSLFSFITVTNYCWKFAEKKFTVFPHIVFAETIWENTVYIYSLIDWVGAYWGSPKLGWTWSERIKTKF